MKGTQHGNRSRRSLGPGIAAIVALLTLAGGAIRSGHCLAPAGSPAPPAAPPRATPVAPATPPGRLLIPVQGVRAADLEDTYDQARSENRRHDAIDIPAPRGTPVLAAAAGTVLKRFHSKRGGTTLYILDPDGHTVYYYAHLDRYADNITEKLHVAQGDVIAYVGDSGDAGPGNCHLHFEITTVTDPARWWQGIPQNPYPRLGGPPRPRRAAPQPH